MPESIFLINQVIHDLQEDCDYRILWTASSPARKFQCPGEDIS